MLSMRIRNGWMLLILLFCLALSCLAGCGGSAPHTITQATPTPTPHVLFASNRALDGSDAINAPNNAWNIWTMKPDGSALAPLTKLASTGASYSSSLDYAPLLSPDGSKVVFSSGRALDGSDAANINNTQNIWVMNADGSGAAPLTKLTASGAQSFKPAWSPDGRKIAFVSRRALDSSDAGNLNLTGNIWVMNSDGSGAAPLTKLTANNAGYGNPPVWSPDGAKIACDASRALDGSDAQGANGANNIWVMNADGTNAVPLTKDTASGLISSLALWSPSGAKLAYLSRRKLDGSDAPNLNGTTNIWTMNADGSNSAPLTKLTASGAGYFDYPAWSADASKIVSTSGRALDGSDAASTISNLWIMNADGSNATPLTKLTANTAFNAGPVWTGNKILFESNRALDGTDAAITVNNIWIINADGTAPTPLTKLTKASNALNLD